MFKQFYTPVVSACTAAASKTVLSLSTPAVSTSLITAASAAASSQQQSRSVSVRSLKQRMVVVGNIRKITKAMKMVASAKIARNEKLMVNARNFGTAMIDMWPQKKIQATDDLTPAKTEIAEGKTGIYCLISVSPDRGLCGSTNGSVVRRTRVRGNFLRRIGKNIVVVPMGEKSRAGLERLLKKEYIVSFSDHSKLKRRTFKTSVVIADHFLRQVSFDEGEILHNQFINMVSFETQFTHISGQKEALAEATKAFEVYDFEGDSDIMEHFYQWCFALRVHVYLAESDMVEQSQRVSSMTNSSRNADDMMKKIKILYNRVRQGKVTTELCEIIAGTIASDDQMKAQNQ